jgi:hypothetical protein
MCRSSSASCACRPWYSTGHGARPLGTLAVFPADTRSHSIIMTHPKPHLWRPSKNVKPLLRGNVAPPIGKRSAPDVWTSRGRFRSRRPE